MVTVDSIEQTVALVVANGGEQVGDIVAMSETARYAYIRDSEGNLIGLYGEAAAASDADGARSVPDRAPHPLGCSPIRWCWRR